MPKVLRIVAVRSVLRWFLTRRGLTFVITLSRELMLTAMSRRRIKGMSRMMLGLS
jgi:hypothetical protein